MNDAYENIAPSVNATQSKRETITEIMNETISVLVDCENQMNTLAERLVWPIPTQGETVWDKQPVMPTTEVLVRAARDRARNIRAAINRLLDRI